jgi:hypothetical protein
VSLVAGLFDLGDARVEVAQLLVERLDELADRFLPRGEVGLGGLLVLLEPLGDEGEEALGVGLERAGGEVREFLLELGLHAAQLLEPGGVTFPERGELGLARGLLGARGLEPRARLGELGLHRGEALGARAQARELLAQGRHVAAAAPERGEREQKDEQEPAQRREPPERHRIERPEIHACRRPAPPFSAARRAARRRRA